MSTAVAPATAAPLTSHVDRAPSPKNHHSLAPTSAMPSSRMPSGTQEKSSPEGKKTPNSNAAPKIIVKKEPPSSPTISSQTRPRPRKLDLSASTLSVRGPAGPMTARDGLGLHEVGLACLSPGFQTHDPERQEQLQRSIAVREQQRSIIESRLQKSAKGDGSDSNKSSESNPFGSLKIAKKRPPPGLSIVPPSASQFANERVVQSAPLNKTFTGRHDPMPITRHLIGHTANLPSPSHIHHVPAQQTNNRLPPLSDVFGSDLASRQDRERNGPFPGSGVNSSQSTTTASTIPPFSSSPGHNGTSQQRPREYRSAEEAVQELSGGREELLPRIIHYNGHQQPATPPSPYSNGNVGSTSGTQQTYAPPPSQGTSRRRTRSEYEQDNGSPPLGTGPDMRFRNGPGPAVSSYGPFGAGRDSPETQRKKKEEFLSLCSRAWDLFHS
ncbi:conserved hypothetical protein [Talaromyces stipitatus ATCC 10500]|uniref:Uncharacterized protein n=1 Tax=Talaromyces stipitatus (strain ATCC 10500 / CBS 375.48 / QM 6759 / NRRL 1006) TaxID=441959 RepID=B8MSM5_TALSN|nr:uncharacterized protein TSTA_005000 [Talaromyces stipitatus ATCC 10500]EED12462.1 conserved hypothetical protein [Talaromyces stipitatus ATCC 10500]